MSRNTNTSNVAIIAGSLSRLDGNEYRIDKLIHHPKTFIHRQFLLRQIDIRFLNKLYININLY